MGSQSESGRGLFSARKKVSMQQYCAMVLDEGKHLSMALFLGAARMQGDERTKQPLDAREASELKPIM